MILTGLRLSVEGFIYEAPKQSTANDVIVANCVLATKSAEKTEFIDCAFWQKDAELIMRYPVGHRISIDCSRLAYHPYLDKNGKPQVRLKANVVLWHSVMPLETKNNSSHKEEQQSVQSSTQQNTSPSSSEENEKINELKKALNFKFSTGKHAGKKVAEVLQIDPLYIYNLCTENGVTPQLKHLLCIAYQYWYSKTQQKQSKTPQNSGRIDGVERNNVAHVPATTPDRDLPF